MKQFDNYFVTWQKHWYSSSFPRSAPRSQPNLGELTFLHRTEIYFSSLTLPAMAMNVWELLHRQQYACEGELHSSLLDKKAV